MFDESEHRVFKSVQDAHELLQLAICKMCAPLIEASRALEHATEISVAVVEDDRARGQRHRWTPGTPQYKAATSDFALEFLIAEHFAEDDDVRALIAKAMEHLDDFKTAVHRLESDFRNKLDTHGYQETVMMARNVIDGLNDDEEQSL